MLWYGRTTALSGWDIMRAFIFRVLRNGLPVAGLLALFGFGMAEMAEMMAGKGEKPTPNHVPGLSAYLRWRVPLGFAAWGFGLVLAFEALFSIWRKPVPPTPPKSAVSPEDEAERLLLQLLAEADAAQRARATPSPADPTPPPLGAVPAESDLATRSR